MQVIKVRNVHEALPEAIHQLIQNGVEENTRNGPVLRIPGPVTTLYTHPKERVLFWPERDANPFFHFYEALWMLGGRNDVASLAKFVPSMKNFSDDGKVFHGAYGYRWRKHWGHDQIMQIGLKLRSNHGDRRQVLQMYDTGVDGLHSASNRDIPCNLVACFQVVDEKLDMIVYNRSNDIIWGCYGANAVHFSMLQEVMAAIVGVEVGKYWQVSFNWHAYKAVLSPLVSLADKAHQPPSIGELTPYEWQVKPFNMVNTPIETWFQDLNMFLDEGDRALGYRDMFFRRVAIPMLRTHATYKAGKGKHKFEQASYAAKDIRAQDWRKAVLEWISRRQVRWEAKH